VIAELHRRLVEIACLLAACSTTPNVSVKTDYDHSASFGKLRMTSISG